MADLKSFAEQLVNLTVKEVNELATILKDEYGIEPAAAAPVMMAGGGGGAAAAEEKTAFDVILKASGPNKLADWLICKLKWLPSINISNKQIFKQNKKSNNHGILKSNG